MPIIVQKFGGTSVANLDRMNEIIPIIISERKLGNKLLVVVSAMAGITNKLISLCNMASGLTTHEALAEYDTAVSSGEIVSASLLALTLQNNNIPARSFLGWQLPIITNTQHGKAIIKKCFVKKIFDCFEKQIIPIVAGFQGITRRNRITTLGRGGSDTTAALLAAAINADRCDIYTDVKGVFTADPRIVVNAQKIPYISFEEMLELSSCGAKILHPRAIEIAMRYKIPITVLSSFISRIKEKNIGTVITSNNIIMEKVKLTAISSNKNLLLLIIKSSSEFNEICQIISSNNIQLEFMQNISSQKGCYFIAPLNEQNNLKNLMQKLEEKNKIDYFMINTKIALVSIVGYSIKNSSNLIHRILKILNENNIFSEMIQLTEIKISILIKETDTEKSIKLLHHLLYPGSK